MQTFFQFRAIFTVASVGPITVIFLAYRKRL
uniref:Photosystem II reaction center protein Ycf12 n=1 Tax=Lepidodinium chlorophorum TaxID=107758 RepID=A0A0F7R0X2_LEPCH|nr:photosystem II reaction center protein Ycf12 [Lepidodinium chlorophorum]YP_009139369.1 photosystem II reaction center protein Ycf12 [Lepidodinium chlorophorum]BAR72340.1 photosystem II reaction center protein Ycf12 [Lepidodinium chlorophorum]BAR72343.1 photosystem II reaction center protein Ycf12 [Lepidodinium chlorophorum]